MNQMDDGELGWVAGIMANTTVRRRDGGRMRIVMVHRNAERIFRLQELTGLGTVTGQAPRYTWMVNTQGDIKELLEAILPFCDEDHQSQLVNVLDAALSGS